MMNLHTKDDDTERCGEWNKELLPDTWPTRRKPSPLTPTSVMPLQIDATIKIVKTQNPNDLPATM
jgi:hypothetical protein